MKHFRTYFFVIVMCSFSALILSIVATSLDPYQKKAEESYRYKELLNAASLLPPKASQKEIEKISNEMITPMLTDSEGNSFTFEEKGINYLEYLEKGAKSGYSEFEYKLYYKIKTGGVILPVNGFGLWDAIYGYIGIAKNGFSIIGISWYSQKETPGLGGEIETPQWQKGFHDKSIFHGPHMKNFGINFVPKEMLQLLPQNEKDFTVDAIAGATLTTNGVKAAIHDSLFPYVPLLRRMHGN